MTRAQAIQDWSDQDLITSYKAHKDLMLISRKLGTVDEEHAHYEKLVENRKELRRRGKEPLLNVSMIREMMI